MKSSNEPSLYMTQGQDILILYLYVYDFKKVMMDEFEMTDLRLMKYFLGMQAKQSPGQIFIS